MTPQQIDDAAAALAAARSGHADRRDPRGGAAAIRSRFLCDPGRGDAPSRRAGRRLEGRLLARGRDFLRPDLCLEGACQPGQPAGMRVSRDRDRVRDRLSR